MLYTQRCAYNMFDVFYTTGYLCGTPSTKLKLNPNPNPNCNSNHNPIPVPFSNLIFLDRVAKFIRRPTKFAQATAI